MYFNCIYNGRASLFLLCLLLLCPICLAADEPGARDLDIMAQETRAMLLKHRPELSDEMDELPGYAIITMKATKIPGVGAGWGYGVVIDNRNQQRSYIKVTQLEVGGGIGAEKFKAVIFLEHASLVDRMIKGGIHYESTAEFGATSEKSEDDGTLSTQSGKGFKVFKLTESGALATITVRVLSGKPYLSD
jgi:hypothetical protein